MSKNPQREPGPWMNEYHPELNPRADILWSGESMTRQSEAAECDINNIMAKYAVTGMLPQLVEQSPSYGDFSSMPDYIESQNIVAFAKSQFAALPAETRAFFQNDPGQMLDYVDKHFPTAGPEREVALKNLTKLGLTKPIELPKETPEDILRAIRDNTKAPPVSTASKPSKPSKDGSKVSAD